MARLLSSGCLSLLETDLGDRCAGEERRGEGKEGKGRRGREGGEGREGREGRERREGGEGAEGRERREGRGWEIEEITLIEIMSGALFSVCLLSLVGFD
jgi:hypothetical protein